MTILCQGSCLTWPEQLSHKLGGLHRRNFSEFWRLRGTNSLCAKGWVLVRVWPLLWLAIFLLEPYMAYKVLLPSLKAWLLRINHLPKSSPVNTTKKRSLSTWIFGKHNPLVYHTSLYVNHSHIVRISVVVWRMLPIGSYIWMLQPQLVECLGRTRRCGVLLLQLWGVKSPCHS